MSLAGYSSPSKWSSLKELLVMGLLEGIPRKPGIMLRNFLYPTVLGHLGQSVQIQNNVEFTSPWSIEIGNEVIIERNASLNSYGQNNQILIGDQVKLAANVRLNNSGQNNRILIGKQVKLDANVSLKGDGQNTQIILNDRVWLESGVNITPLDNGSIEIGEGTYMGLYTCLLGPGHIKIGKDCLIAAQSGLFANQHKFADPTRKIRHQGVTGEGIVIEDDCWLGSGVRVLDGVKIGRGSVIGAGAVVTKDIPPYSVALGVPAKVIRQREGVTPLPVEVRL